MESIVITFLNDLKYGIRQLRKAPGFTLVAVTTLAMGIGATAALFSVVNAVLLHPLPYQAPDQIVTLLHDGRNPVAPADFLDWQAQAQSFDTMAAVEMWGGTLTGGEQTEDIGGVRMSEGAMALLGVPPLLGRTFQPDDYQPGNQQVVILSHRLWQRRFGGSPRAIGRSITLDHQAYRVVGVMSAGFEFPPFWATKSEMWAPLSLVDRASNRGGNSLRVFARLRSGVTPAQAQIEMDAICKRLEEAFPSTNTGRTVRVDALLDQVVGGVRRALLVLLGAVLFVLLIACANVAHLLLVRAAVREKEMAIRTALGASRWRSVRQLLTESLVLASVGGLVGLLIGVVGVAGIRTLLAGEAKGLGAQLPRVQNIAMDMPSLLFTAALALLTTVVFGLAPALQAGKANARHALKESKRGTSGGRRGGRLRAVLVVTEVALALVMLVAAGLLMNSFVRLVAIDPGFATENVLSMTVSLAGQDEVVGPRREAFYQQVFEKIEALPGVRSASAINHLPLAGDQWGFHIAIEGRPAPAPGEEIGAVYRVCRPGYFSTMGMSLLAGRDFSEQDRLGSPGVVIINEALARQQFGNEDPVGQRLTLDDPRGTPTWRTIIGVAENAVQRSWTEEASAEIYLPWHQSKDYVEGTPNHFAYMTLVIRMTADPHTLVRATQDAIWSINRDVPISNVATLEQLAANALWQQRFNLSLIGVFACLAVVLAGVGIYGVMSYAVAQRTPEIGIRMALGAPTTNVLLLVLAQGMKLILAGVGIGIMMALILTRAMRSLLYEVTPTDSVTLVTVSFLLVTVALLACWLPARRAARVAPMTALRHE